MWIILELVGRRQEDLGCSVSANVAYLVSSRSMRGYLREKKNRRSPGLERWLSSYDHLLLLGRNQVQFPAPNTVAHNCPQLQFQGVLHISLLFAMACTHVVYIHA